MTTSPGITLRRMLTLFNTWNIGIKSGVGGFYVWHKNEPDKQYHAVTLGRAFATGSRLHRIHNIGTITPLRTDRPELSDINPNSGFPRLRPNPDC